MAGNVQSNSNLSGALFIVLSKLITGVLCTIGAIGMWRAHGPDLVAYNSAKYIALTGCAAAIIMLFGGFIVVAESWFELWRSKPCWDQCLDRLFDMGYDYSYRSFVASKD